jgi:hypothetical protein
VLYSKNVNILIFMVVSIRTAVLLLYALAKNTFVRY